MKKKKKMCTQKFVGNVNQAIGFQLNSVDVFIYWKKISSISKLLK